MPELPWFDYTQYASFCYSQTPPSRCIAPKADGTRCNPKRRLRLEEVAKAATALQEAQLAARFEARYGYIETYVLKHCCIRWHRKKLRGNPDCLDKVVKAFMSEIFGVPLDALIHIPRSLKMLPYFVPYETEDSETIITLIKSKIPQFRQNTEPRQQTAREGVVYILTWPEYVLFFKIGFSGRSARDRAWEMQTCYPGVEISFEAQVAYPERVEGLIHLELAQHRHAILKCRTATCMKTHTEWFKVSRDVCKSVMCAWVELMQREPLYDATRSLTANWRKRLSKFEGELTAQGLLDLLDREEQEAEEKKEKQEQRITNASSNRVIRVLRDRRETISKNEVSVRQIVSNESELETTETMFSGLKVERKLPTTTDEEKTRTDLEAKPRETDDSELLKKETDEGARTPLENLKQASAGPSMSKIFHLSPSGDAESGAELDQIKLVKVESQKDTPVPVHKAEVPKIEKEAEEDEEKLRIQSQIAEAAEVKHQEQLDEKSTSDRSNAPPETAALPPLTSTAAAEAAVETLTKTADVVQGILVEALVELAVVSSIDSATPQLEPSIPVIQPAVSLLQDSGHTTTPEVIAAAMV